MAGRRILVTGGAGYVGSHLAAHLLETGHEVDVFDNLQTGHRAAVPADVRLIEGDLADAGATEAAIAAGGYDAVMHCAADSLVGESMEQPLRYLADNVANTGNLLRAMVAHGVGRIVFSSTASLFDTGDGAPLTEDAPIRPGNPYGESKRTIETLLAWAERIHGVRHATLRYFNVAGADPSGARGEDHRPETHLIPIVLQAALGRRDKITIFGDDYDTPDGTCVRDYVHVLDVAAAHALALDALEARGGRAYNLGGGRGHSVRDVVETAKAVTGAEIPVEIAPRRPGDVAVLVASAERITRELGWRPRFDTLEAIVETAWTWHRDHPDGFAD